MKRDALIILQFPELKQHVTFFTAKKMDKILDNPLDMSSGPDNIMNPRSHNDSNSERNDENSNASNNSVETRLSSAFEHSVSQRLPDKENIDPITSRVSPLKKPGSQRRAILKDITEKFAKKPVPVNTVLSEPPLDTDMDEMFDKLTDSPLRRHNFREL